MHTEDDIELVRAALKRDEETTWDEVDLRLASDRVIASARELAPLRALVEREVQIKDNTINDVRNRAHALLQRAESAERRLEKWAELQALLVDDPAEAARRIAMLTDQERWSREPEIDSRPGDDDYRVPDSG